MITARALVSGFVRLLIMLAVIAMIALAVSGAALFMPGPKPAFGHDSWISRGQMRSHLGELCCGAGDCGVFDKDTISVTSGGYRAHGYLTIVGTKERIFIDETVPFSEAQPSPDGTYVRCHRSDGTRRCFFAPPPNS